jgi:hypothetical protein
MPARFQRTVHRLWRYVAPALAIVLLVSCAEKPSATLPVIREIDRARLTPESLFDAKSVPTAPPFTTSSPAPATDAPPSKSTGLSTGSAAAEWLVMLYLDADDSILERDILMDLNEAETVGSTDQVYIVAQVDRFDGGYDGMGDWHSTKRFFLTQDDDLNTLNSVELSDLGELNMADGNTLRDFIVWAVQNFPARRHLLVMSDHGNGWPGGFSDPDPGGRGAHNLFLAQHMNDNLWLMELESALESSLAQTGLRRLDLIGFDACLMSQLEVYNALAPYARYAVASEELEPALGWAYSAFLSQLAASPFMDADALARAIVSSYIDRDVRLLDDTARREFLQYQKINTEMNANTLADELWFDATLAAVDLSAIQNLSAALDSLAGQMATLERNTVAEARAYAQAFENIFDPNIPPPYIDLGHLALWLREAQYAGREAIIPAADQLLMALDQAVISERHGAGRPGATGLSIYFPTRELYELGNNLDYDTIAARFSQNHQWDDFLRAYFAGEQRAGRGPSVELLKPIRIEPIALSSEIARPGQPINLQTQVTGDHLGFLYSFVGRVLPDEERLIIEDVDYLFAEETATVGGVPYPVWSPHGVSVDFDWEPQVYAINDGAHTVRALLAPDTYGKVPTYATEGTYVFADGSDSVDAKLFFRDGQLTKVFGYAGRRALGSPHQITPQSGDQFIVREQGINLRDDAPQDDFSQDGGALTFGDESLTIDAIPAPSGAYVVGVFAEDLEGEIYAEFETLFVENSTSSAVDGFVPYASPDLGFAVLYPEDWEIEEESDEATVTFYGDQGVTLAMVVRDSYPDATSAAEANQLAMQDLLKSFDTAGDLEALEFVTEVEDFVLGGFDARTIDFTFALDGDAYYGSAIVATPVPGATYAFLILALDADYNGALDQFNPMLQSFDILISGVPKEQAGPPPPDFEAVLGYDDFSTAGSGLQEVNADWGASYYSDEQEYVYVLNPDAGPIQDHYQDGELPDPCMIEATASYSGAANNGYGLIFRYLDASRFYTFRISGDGFYTVERAEGDKLVTLVPWTPSERIDQQELWGNVLTVVGRGDAYELYINAQRIDSFSDGAYRGGSFGFIVDNFNPDLPASFYFDDYIIGKPAE